ncbi:MAG: serine hydrolase [Bacteroidales bacterium]|nr:serine hydrolase [Bacteroidales bacterium]MBN2748889.1 serine hydrolase [Bacteroidales bacterium]
MLFSITGRLKSLLIAIVLLCLQQAAAKAGILSVDSLKIIQADIRSGLYGKISSLVISKDGKIDTEIYFGVSTSNTLHPISSVTKSITSILVGIGLDKGLISSVDKPAYTYFPELENLFKQSPEKKSITIRHLLDQTAGFAWNEWNPHYSYADNALVELTNSRDKWYESIFNLPLESPPGTKFNYNSGCTEILKEIICRAMKMDFESITNRYLFAPLGITNYKWDSYPRNGNPAWGGIYLSTKDMAKIGLLINQKGQWKNRSIVSREWVAMATSPQIKNNSLQYGFLWWIDKQPDGNPLIFAAGYGDQYVYIAPDKNLVIAINGENFTDYHWPQNPQKLIQSLLNAYNSSSN